MTDKTTTPKLCLFCGPMAASFRKLEHIIPESLGNTEFVLIDTVCDKCNQYFSKLEGYFTHYHLTSPARLVTVRQTKKGKPPSQTLKRGEMRKQPNGKLDFSQPILPGHENEQLQIIFSGNEVTIKGSFILEDADSRKLSRFLAKCGLETLFFKKGPLAFEDEFNAVRSYARHARRNDFVSFLWANKQRDRAICYWRQ